MRASPSHFQSVELLPPDAIFNLTDTFKADKFENKINLGVGAYRDEQGKTHVLKVVRKAEDIINGKEDHEYLPIAGHSLFRKHALKLVTGNEEDRFSIVQAISGTGALRIGAEFIKNTLSNTTVLISNPTWANHRAIFECVGLKVEEYRYYDPSTRGLAFNDMKTDIMNAPNGSVILLHACAHNP
eukprot:NODE_2_length_91304_cov_0.692462.p54 type:complete len:185 gc:universal NODE_2_length_91304_cov_0.692462:10830-10276(-)